MSKTYDDILSWSDKLQSFNIENFEASKSVIISVDMINAFCKFGNLSCLNCRSISEDVALFLQMAYNKGFKDIVLVQDSHSANDVEFDSFNPHSLSGSKESDTIVEIKELEFYDKMHIFYKNSLSIAYSDIFNNYLKENSHFENFIIIGVCTDLCVYNMISHLKLSANSQNIKRNIIVPYSLVSTFDMQLHNANFYHNVFLNHASMAFGAKIYKTLI